MLLGQLFQGKQVLAFALAGHKQDLPKGAAAQLAHNLIVSNSFSWLHLAYGLL